MAPLLALALNVPFPSVALGGTSLNPERPALIFAALASALAAAVETSASSPTTVRNLASLVFIITSSNKSPQSLPYDAPTIKKLSTSCKCWQTSPLAHAFPSKEIAGDDLALDLGRPLVDTGGAHFAVKVLEEMPLLQRDRAVDLDGHINDLLRGLGGEQLRHRGATRNSPVAAIVLFGGGIDERARRLEPRRHLRELMRAGWTVRARQRE